MDTLAQMRTEVRRALFEMDEDLFTDSEIDDWLNEAAKLMCKLAKPQDFVYSFQPTEIASTGVYNHEYAMPEGTDQIFEVFIEQSANQLTPLPIKKYKSLHGTVGNAAGIPAWCYTRAYAFEVLQRTTAGIDTDEITGVTEGSDEPRIILGLYPKPSNDDITIWVNYYARHATMSDDNDVPSVPLEFRRGMVHYAVAMGMIKDAANADSDWHMEKFKFYSDRFQEDMISKGQDLSFPYVVDDEEEGHFPGFSVGWLTE